MYIRGFTKTYVTKRARLNIMLHIHWLSCSVFRYMRIYWKQRIHNLTHSFQHFSFFLSRYGHCSPDWMFTYTISYVTFIPTC